MCRIGYFLNFREHNQGYATEVLLAVVDWLFRYTDVKRIEAGVTLHNIPSYRVLEKVGFIREKIIEGNWKWYDKVYDSAYYYLLKRSTHYEDFIAIDTNRPFSPIFDEMLDLANNEYQKTLHEVVFTI